MNSAILKRLFDIDVCCAGKQVGYFHIKKLSQLRNKTAFDILCARFPCGNTFVDRYSIYQPRIAEKGFLRIVVFVVYSQLP